MWLQARWSWRCVAVVVRLVCDSDTSTIRLMTTREKVERLLDRLSETELEADVQSGGDAVDSGFWERFGERVDERVTAAAVAGSHAA